MPVSSPYPLVSIEHALSTILAHSPALPSESIPLAQSLDRVLAEEIIAPAPVPPFPAAAKDGYAVIAADGAGRRRLAGEQMAGPIAAVRVESGTVARITTGAAVPPGADAIVMVEQTSEHDGWVEIETEVSAGNEIRPIGQDIAAGQKLLSPGVTLGP
ncbi:MAG: hypothetical protein J5I90_13580, partial [Caldilineales bacterium]|nr:hypothetical protein [Caldilineales bacterium]